MNRNLVTMNLDKNTKVTVKRIGKELVIYFGEDMIFMDEEQAEESLLQLDAELHDKTETREYMEERIEILENMVADMEENYEVAGLPCDDVAEYDFYDKAI